MNRCYRLIFNRSLQVWQAVSEHTRSASKGGSVSKPALAVVLSLSAGMAMADHYIENGETVTVPIDQSSPWNTGGILGIGNNGTAGTLFIQGGASVTSTDSYVGYAGVGEATVTGGGAAWTSTANIYIGNAASGTLNIENGGLVTNTNGKIGEYNAAVGIVNVRGANSTWTNSGDLYVGIRGSGTLNIENGGLVTNTNGRIGEFLAGVGSTANVRGANSTWTNSGALYVGQSGSGTLNIENGGLVTNTDGRIGEKNTGEGTANVRGANSTWTNSGMLRVGESGRGTLNIENGGLVTNTDGSIGEKNTGEGTVNVRGANSRWTNSGHLYVGQVGNGTLNVEDGGVVTSAYGTISHGQWKTGAVTVTGTGSRWTNMNDITVGVIGNGTLAVKEGGVVENAIGSIGANFSSTGAATVTGTGSRWTNSSVLYVGQSGSGMLNIDNGGHVSALETRLAVNGSSFGTVNLNGSSNARGVLETRNIGKGAGTVTFNWNGGILRATHTNTDFLPNFGVGSINVQSGGAFFDTQHFDVGFSTAGVLSGTGDFTKLGSGTLTIAGDNTYSGNTNVSAGTLTFASYHQTAVQTLGIGARSTTDYGKLNVTGAATFNAGTGIHVDVATMQTLGVDNILTDVITAGTLSANGFKVTDNSALFNFEAIQNANGVDLKVIASSNPSSNPSGNPSGNTSIQGAVSEQGYTGAVDAARVLNAQLISGAGGDMGNVISALGRLSSNREVARAVVQTLPLQSSTPAIQSMLTSFQNVVQNRNSAMRGMSSGDALSNKQAWVRGFGSRASQDDRDGTSGFTSDSWGLVIGADGEVSRETRFGLAYGYAKTDVDGNADISGTAQRDTIDSHVISAYGSTEVGEQRQFLYQADLGMSSNEITRQLSFGGLERTARADYHTYSGHIGAALAQTFTLGEKTTLTPALRADYTWLKAQGYNETGADALNLQVASQKTKAFVIGADANLLHRISPADQIQANLGVGYDTINDRGNIVAAYAGAPGQSFITSGIDHSPWLIRGGLGYSRTTMKGVEIALRYDAEGRSGYLNHTASVKARWAF